MVQLKYRYPGTKPFTTEDQHIFKGRKKDTERLFDLLKSKNMIVFHAESGLGKSSLINAGLVPLFQNSNSLGGFLPVKIRFGANENRGTEKYDDSETLLLKKLLAQLEEYQSKFQHRDLPFVKDMPQELWYRIKLFERNGINVLLIFDQCEEVFTYTHKQIRFFKEQIYSLLSTYIPSSLDKRIEEYLEQLESTGDPAKESEERFRQINNEVQFIYKPLNTKVLFVVREDKFGLFDMFSDYFPDILKDTYKLKPLAKEEAIEAITLPAQAEGDFASKKFSFNEDKPSPENGLTELLETLVEDNNTYDPFSIQLNCSYIERFAVIGKKKQAITKADIPQRGMVEKEFYDNAWKVLPKISDEQLLEVQKTFESRIVDRKSRRRVFVLSSDLLEDDIRDKLIEYGLIRLETKDDSDYIELSHDRLINTVIESYNYRIRNEEKEEEIQSLKRIKIVTRKRVLLFGSLAVIILVISAYFNKRLDSQVTELKAKSATISELQKQISILIDTQQAQRFRELQSLLHATDTSVGYFKGQVQKLLESENVRTEVQEQLQQKAVTTEKGIYEDVVLPPKGNGTLAIKDHFLSGANVTYMISSRAKMRSDNYPIKFASIHATGTPGGSAKKVAALFQSTDPYRSNSAHLIIDTDGSVIQCVAFNYVAYHAGLVREPKEFAKKFLLPTDKSRYISPNSYSIGIELTGYPGKPFSRRQLEVCRQICLLLRSQYNIKTILAHSETDSGKEDPGPTFPMDQFRSEIFGQR